MWEGLRVSRIGTAEVVLPPDEPARLAAVRRYHILDTPSDRAFDRVAELAARVLAGPIATVSIVDSERIWFKARRGLDQTLVIELGLRFYAGWPIVTSDGYRLGTVDVMDVQPRQLAQDEVAVLADLAAMVADELELRLSAGRAVEAERALRIQLEREKTLVEQIAALEAERTSQLEHALTHRVVVEQAKGVLMGREDLGSVDDAFERLRAVARSQRRPVEELAREVVAGQPLPPVTRSTRQRPRGGAGTPRVRRPDADRRAGGSPDEGDASGEFSDRTLRITRKLWPHGLCLQGEVDQANIAMLAAALATVVDSTEDVHLDLAGLEFIDVGGLRLLTETAGRLPAGQYLVLDGVAPYLRRILSLVGWDRAPGLKIGGDQP